MAFIKTDTQCSKGKNHNQKRKTINKDNEKIVTKR